MEELLIENTECGQHPHGPPQLHGDPVQVAQVEPGGVGPSYEEVDHGTVTAVEEVFPDTFIADSCNYMEHSGHGEETSKDSSIHQGSVGLGGASGIGEHQVAQPEGGDDQDPMGHNVGKMFLLCWHIGIVISWSLILPVRPEDSLASQPQVVQPQTLPISNCFLGVTWSSI